MLVGGREFSETPMGVHDAADHMEALGFAKDAREFRSYASDYLPWWSRVAHWFGRCLRCETYNTDEGIGGRCVDCGKIHGWVTRDELRTYADRTVR